MFLELHYCLCPNEIRRKSSTNTDFPGRVYPGRLHLYNRSHTLVENQTSVWKYFAAGANNALGGGGSDRVRGDWPDCRWSASRKTRPPLARIGRDQCWTPCTTTRPHRRIEREHRCCVYSKFTLTTTTTCTRTCVNTRGDRIFHRNFRPFVSSPTELHHTTTIN